jgi:hypothetical protein
MAFDSGFGTKSGAESHDLSELQFLGVFTTQLIQLKESAQDITLLIIKFKSAKYGFPVFCMKAALAVHHQGQIAFGRNACISTDIGEGYFFLLLLEEAVESSQNFGGVIGLQQDLINLGAEGVVGNSIADGCQGAGLKTIGHGCRSPLKRSGLAGEDARTLEILQNQNIKQYQGGEVPPRRS